MSEFEGDWKGMEDVWCQYKHSPKTPDIPQHGFVEFGEDGVLKEVPIQTGQETRSPRTLLDILQPYSTTPVKGDRLITAEFTRRAFVAYDVRRQRFKNG